MGRVVHLSLVQTTAGIDDDFGDAILLLVQHGLESVPLASQWRVKGWHRSAIPSMGTDVSRRVTSSKAV